MKNGYDVLDLVCLWMEILIVMVGEAPRLLNTGVFGEVFSSAESIDGIFAILLVREMGSASKQTNWLHD